MKKIIFNIIVTCVGIALYSCQKDFLNRPPLDRLDAETFFNSATDLEVYTNGFYSAFPSYGTLDEHDDASDNVARSGLSTRVLGTRIVPVTRGTGGWSWTELRSLNFFLTNYQKCPDEAAKKKFGGIAKFFRASFYYDKVKTFGDVPWYGKELKAGDEDLYKAKDSRILVMDSVLADINFAIDNIPAEKSLNRVTKYTALALKARICLFEGTFRKYHNIEGYQKFLNEAVSASEQLMNTNAYTLFTTGGVNASYRQLFSRNNQDVTETILAVDYHTELRRHNLAYLLTSPTMGSFGMTKDMVNTYLMKDGSRFTDISGYSTMGFYQEMQNRDPRLQQTAAGPDYIVTGDTKVEPVDLSGSITGYRIIKSLPTRDQWIYNVAYNDQIVFRFAEVLLVYAEAKAELGTINQSDLDKSVNRLRTRVAMPNMNLAAANSSPDPYLALMYPNVDKGPNKGIILEIRRERRVELYMEGLRWDDLMRWKEGKKLEKPMLGVYFSGLGGFDFNNDGKVDVFLHNGNTSGIPSGTPTIIDIRQRPLSEGLSGYLSPYKSTTRIFNEARDYYYPIPTEDLNLNKNLKQNPGWM
jgi:hypothetical protein